MSIWNKASSPMSDTSYPPGELTTVLKFKNSKKIDRVTVICNSTTIVLNVSFSVPSRIREGCIR